MNARDAYNKASRAYKGEDKFLRILKYIESNAVKGEFSCDLPYILDKDIQYQLEALNYKVYDSSDRFNTYTTISWGFA